MKTQSTTRHGNHVEVRNGKDTSVIGIEIAHAHKLFCHLRRAGATHDDVVRLAEKDSVLYDWIVAGVRGVLPLDLEETSCKRELVNLDREPDLCLEKTGLSRYSIIRDDRLGVWIHPDSDSWYNFGDYELKVMGAKGSCIDQKDNYFAPGDLRIIHNDRRGPRVIDLNYQAALWLNDKENAGDLFETIGDGEWRREKIFFLGTVWKEVYQEGRGEPYEVICAPAFTANKSGNIKFESTPLPKGNWPSSCYVAVLMPR